MIVADVETNNTARFDINQVLPSTSGMFPFMTGNPSNIMHTYNELTAATGQLPAFLPNQGTITYRMDQNGITTTNQDCFAVGVIGVYMQDADNTHTCTPISVIAAPIDNCNTNGTFTLNSTPTGGAQPVTFEWAPAANITGSVNAQNSAGEASNEIVNFSITAEGADGCIAKDDEVVAHCEQPAMVYQICNTTSTIFLATINNPPGNVVTANGPILINGLFTIDHDINFINCQQIELSPNARIVVVPGRTLTFKSCRLSTCQDYMWDGIYLSQANGQVSRLIAGDSEFEHAVNAVVSDGGGDYQIDRCIFRDCHIGIRVQNYNPITNNLHPGRVTGSTFIQSFPLLPPFCGEKYFAGIDVSDVDDLTIGNNGSVLNTFDNLRYGVRAYRSDVTLFNNAFQHIYVDPNIVPPSTAIVSEGAVVAWSPLFQIFNVIDTRMRVLGDASGNPHNSFFDCHYGVYTVLQRTEVSNGNTFNTVNNGVWLIESNNGSVGSSSTGGNTFINNNFGIAIRVEDVFINVNRNEQVFNNTISNHRTGVFLTSAGFPRVENNTISFSAGGLQGGISVSGCRNLIIHSNAVSHNANPTAAVALSRYGILSSNNTPRLTISHNTFTRMGTGINIRGANNPSLLVCNDNNIGFNGFRFQTANIGHQAILPGTTALRATDNTWNAMIGGGRRMTGGVTPLVLWIWRPTLQLFNPTLPFISTTGVGYWSANTTSPCPYTPQIQEPPNPEARSLMFEYSIMDTADMGDYAEGLRYYQQEAVYSTFREDSTWLYLNPDDDSLYQAFYTNLRNSNSEKFIASMEKAVSGKADEAIAINNSISPSNILEQNRKTVNDILFRTWAKDSLVLSDEYYQTLNTIAYLHPLTNGPGVYTARVMLGLHIEDDYDGSGKTDEIPIPITDEIQFTKIYPNPNNGQMQMDYLLPNESTGTLQIIDFNGRVLQNYPLTEGIHTLSINILEYSRGIYFARLFVNGNYQYSEKIVLIE